jgi:anamorsin
MTTILIVYTSKSKLKAALPGELHQSILFSDESSLSSALDRMKGILLDEARFVDVIPSDDTISFVFDALKPWAKLIIQNIESREVGQEISTDLKIQGFSNVLAASDEGERFVVCQKPDIEIGNSATLPTKSTSSNTKTAVWSMQTSDLAEDDLVDEDDLLDDGLVVVPAACEPNGESKGEGKRRACKNCSCGLAEQEAAEVSNAKSETTAVFKDVKSSGCGNCSKGDAFRCGGCPFLGKPVFEPGSEKLVLAMGDDFD